MSIKLNDEEGNEVELPINSIDEIKNLTEAQTKVGELQAKLQEYEGGEGDKNWKATREKITQLESHIGNLKTRLKDAGMDPDDDKNKSLTIEEINQKVVEVVTATEIKKINGQKDGLINVASSGDEEKAKQIKAKMDEIFGENRQFNDVDALKKAVKDATDLVNISRDSGSNGPGSFFHSGGGGMGPGGPQRSPSNSHLERGREIAEAIGYKSPVVKKD